MRMPSLAAVLTLFCATLAHANTVIYQSSFEAPTFTSGASPDGIQGWEVLAGDAVVEAAPDPDVDGAQAVRLSNGASFDIDLLSRAPGLQNSDQVFVQGYFRGAGSNVTLDQAEYPNEPASAIIHFSSSAGIQFYDGDKGASGSGIVPSRVVTPNPPITLGAGTWRKITLFLDFTSQTWNAYVGDTATPVNGQPLGFKDNVQQLKGFRNLSQTETYFDGFRVVVPVLGDVNGDGAADTADVVRLMDFIGSSINDPILAYVANVDAATGGVTQSDVMVLTNAILGHNHQ